MNSNEFRQKMQAYRQSINAEARSLKEPDLVREKLHALYVRLDPNERRVADEVISEWTLSEDEATRFDALVLIDDFRIAAATSALRELANRLAVKTTPNAIYELKKVTRIISALTGRLERSRPIS